MDRLFGIGFNANFLELLNRISGFPSLDIKMLDPEKTVLVIMDMTEGMIKNPHKMFDPLKGIIEPVAELLRKFKDNKTRIIAFSDSHNYNSTEFRYLTPHCIEGSEGTEIITELRETGGYQIMRKNSLNGFHCPDFQRYLAENIKRIENYVVCGIYTDFSVMNFCLTLKSYYDQMNKEINVIVPYNAIETFSSDVHVNDLFNVISLQHMASQGIEIVKDIR